jgi:hypothetical protein
MVTDTSENIVTGPTYGRVTMARTRWRRTPAARWRLRYASPAECRSSAAWWAQPQKPFEAHIRASQSWSAPRLVGKFAGDHFAKAAFGPQPDIGPKGRSGQDMAEPARSTHLLVCIGHGQGTSRVTDPVKKIVTNPAHGPAASGATNPARL